MKYKLLGLEISFQLKEPLVTEVNLILMTYTKCLF